ncbi:MAG: hypothetical protein C5S49_06690 [Candidatus Methanogaster sp.]|nr:MAG: hypothetical protein C5S49_06690 [ANME-2 cluster archaeon]
MLGTMEHMNHEKIELAIGSSGTIINLAEIARKIFKKVARKEILYLNRATYQRLSPYYVHFRLMGEERFPASTLIGRT